MVHSKIIFYLLEGGCTLIHVSPSIRLPVTGLAYGVSARVCCHSPLTNGLQSRHQSQDRKFERKAQVVCHKSRCQPVVASSNRIWIEPHINMGVSNNRRRQCFNAKDAQHGPWVCGNLRPAVRGCRTRQTQRPVHPRILSYGTARDGNLGIYRISQN